MKTNLKFNEIITTARLPVSTRNKLSILSKLKNKTMSEIIIDSLENYYEQQEKEGIDSFTLGEHLFGKYGSEETDLSTTYKQRIHDKLRQKYAAQGLDC